MEHNLDENSLDEKIKLSESIYERLSADDKMVVDALAIKTFNGGEIKPHDVSCALLARTLLTKDEALPDDEKIQETIIQFQKMLLA